MTVGVSAFAPFDISYGLRVPYLTVAEYKAAPTAIDTSNLLAASGPEQQDQALSETIDRASSWVDQFTCGATGTLCAVQTTENGRIWGNRYGQIIVHPKYWPIISVDAFTYSPQGAAIAQTGASITPADSVVVEPQEFIVQPTGTVGWNQWSSTGIACVPYECTWTYTNGWPNTTLAASVANGATSFVPTTITGIVPGSLLTLYDLPNDEAVTVSPTYVPGASVVPITTQFQYAHSTGTLTNMPPAIKQATIFATTALIKLRGSGALVVDDMGPVTHTDLGVAQGAGTDWADAMELLKPFKMTFMGY